MPEANPETNDHARSPLRIVIAGASGGIGAALVDALLNRQESLPGGGMELFALSRSRPPDLPSKARWLPLDLGKEPTIANAAAVIGERGGVDLVIVATGILHDGGLKPEKDWRQIEPEQMAKVLAINTIGPALMVKHFAPLLRRDERTVFAVLSARVGSICDNRAGGWYAYRASKAALNQIIRTASIELARKRKQAILVGLHPGTVATGLSEPFRDNSFERFSPEKSAGHLLDVIAQLGTEASGRVFDWQGKEIPA